MKCKIKNCNSNVHVIKHCLCKRHYKQSVYDKDKQRDTNLKKNRGISLEEYNAILSKQQGLCAVCNQPEVASKKGVTLPLAVDHCHATDSIRGLLCVRCNLLLGFIENRDNKLQLLSSCIKYLNTRIIAANS